MNYKIYAIVVALTLSTILGLGINSMYQTVQATGCPVETVIPFIDDAMKSLEAGDTQTALSQLQDAKKELSDSFEVEDE